MKCLLIAMAISIPMWGFLYCLYEAAMAY